LRRNVSETGDIDDVIGAAVGAAFVLAPIVLAVGFMIWLAGQASALLSGNGWPDASPREVPEILFKLATNPTDVIGAWPAAAGALLGPTWLVIVLSILFNIPVAVAIYFIVRFVMDIRRRRVWRKWRLGFASRSEIVRMLGSKALLAKAGQIRPSLAGARKVPPTDVGYYLGRDSRSGQKLWASVEDGMLVIGAPRQGKDAHFVTANVIDAPGPVIVTSSRPDIFTATYEARSQVGNVYVFDPQNFTKWPQMVRFSPILGCDDMDDAKKRADYLFHTTGLTLEGGETRAIIEAKTTLRYLLHAAAVADKTIRDVARWAENLTDREPIDILRRYEAVGAAAPGTAAALEKTAARDPEHREKVAYFTSRAMYMFVNPRVMEACSATSSEALLMGEFVKGRNTLYLLDREGEGSHLGALLGLMLGDLVGRARTMAARSPGGRLDPPLTLELNDAVTVAHLPGIPDMMVDLSAFSIAVHVYIADLKAAKRAWGDGAAALWSNATVRVVLGGSGSSDDLAELASLMGSTDDRERTTVRNIMSIDEIRTMEFGKAVLLARASRPVEIELTPWWKRSDGKEIQRAKKRTEALITTNIKDANALHEARLAAARSMDKTPRPSPTPRNGGTPNGGTPNGGPPNGVPPNGGYPNGGQPSAPGPQAPAYPPAPVNPPAPQASPQAHPQIPAQAPAHPQIPAQAPAHPQIPAQAPVHPPAPRAPVNPPAPVNPLQPPWHQPAPVHPPAPPSTGTGPG
jgi:type IV secretory pathway TraG/TraD family ATPase VirD4